MPLLLPSDYPHVSRLLQQGADVRHRSDGHVVRIAIVNIMPQAELYEFLLLNRLARSPLLVEPLFFRVANHRYGSSDGVHLSRFYRPLAGLFDADPAAVLLTGAPVEHLVERDIHYFEEVADLMTGCRSRAVSLLGLCWGGIAVASFLGVGSQVHQHKLSGVFRSENLMPGHRLMAGCSRQFYCPQSRYASLDEEAAVRSEQKGQIIRLALIAGHGTFLIESSDGLFTAHLGHPEYLPERLLFEYHRDRQSKPALQIHGFDPLCPIDRWSEDANSFFRSWIQQVSDRQALAVRQSPAPGNV